MENLIKIHTVVQKQGQAINIFTTIISKNLTQIKKTIHYNLLASCKEKKKARREYFHLSGIEIRDTYSINRDIFFFFL